MLSVNVWVKLRSNKENEGRLGLARGMRTASFSLEKEYLVLGMVNDGQWLWLIADDFGIPTLLSYHLLSVTRTSAGPASVDTAPVGGQEEKSFLVVPKGDVIIPEATVESIVADGKPVHIMQVELPTAAEAVPQPKAKGSRVQRATDPDVAE